MKGIGTKRAVFSVAAVWMFAAAAPLAASEDGGDIARGKYVAMMMGCNDCHTPNYLMAEGNVPEKLWLTGSAFGWRGPWGTTYPPNLRKFMTTMTEEKWVTFAKTMKARPPMPWFNLNKMHEEDMRALYRYVRHLGSDNTEIPAFVPPDKEPQPPYATFPAPPPAR